MRPSTYEGLETIAKGMLVSTNEAINVILEGYIHPIAPKGGPAQNARVEDASDTEAIAAAELLKANCKNQKNCNKCIFMSNVCCKFEYKTPEEWELPHRKTRKELLLEKFPDAEEAAFVDNICPHNLGLNDNYPDCCGSDVECEQCWNAPAESEEE